MAALLVFYLVHVITVYSEVTSLLQMSVIVVKFHVPLFHYFFQCFDVFVKLKRSGSTSHTRRVYTV